MHNEFFRAVTASPIISVADIRENIAGIKGVLDEIMQLNPDMVVFPELSVTGYTCGDLFHNNVLLKGSLQGLSELSRICPKELPLLIVGAPIAFRNAVYNCAVGITHGKIIGIIPKTYLPTYNEFYERRWFASGSGLTSDCEIELSDGCKVPFSTNLLFDIDGVKIGVEICEDLWVAVPPSCRLALNGADIIANLSASNDVIGKYSYLRSLIKGQSARCICGYVYSSAGYGESTSDLSFNGKAIICENGNILSEANRFERKSKFAVADIDINAIRHDRYHQSSYADCSSLYKDDMTIAECGKPVIRAVSPESILRHVDAHPFVPSDNSHLAERCEEILLIQESALCKRLESTGCKTLVIGISGGLDSTLALLVAVRAFDSLGIDRTGIIGITMPGFGTTTRTHNNATRLMENLGITIREIPIGEAVGIHFRDINHDPKKIDVTYENAQARERTQILMDVANQANGMVLGTGDLSELALGWATYNGDHMSMYAINAGIPKTLVRHLVGYMAGQADSTDVREALMDIIDTPISPELTPADIDDNIVQKTEDLVGPYELHDFFLYHMLRYGESPSRIFLLARKAFEQKYDSATILHWLRTFIRRFFSQQFKRNCMPDGPKVGSITLSPRGDWRMPSDASCAEWLKECDALSM